MKPAKELADFAQLDPATLRYQPHRYVPGLEAMLLSIREALLLHLKLIGHSAQYGFGSNEFRRLAQRCAPGAIDQPAGSASFFTPRRTPA